MRSPNKSRSRNKNNRRNNNNIGNIVNRVFDSNGPDGRVRGTPNQIIEKYEALGRDATLAGDRVEAENFSQHAEHYIRLLAAAQAEVAREQEKRQAEYEARQAQRRSKDEENGEAAGDAQESNAEGGDNAPKEKSKKNRKPRDKKSDEQPSFDEENASDFLKAIND